MSALVAEHLPLLANAPEGIKKLRGLILELAVRGKLVPQDPNDEPASELLKRIADEKARLVAEGKTKRQKSLTEITSDEAPCLLPGSWRWVRLPEIYYPISVSGNKLLSSQIGGEGRYPVVDQGKKFVAGYADDESLVIRIPGPVVVFGDHTTERKYVDFDFIAGADGVKILRPVLLDEKFFWWQIVAMKVEGRGYARHFKVLNDSLFALPPRNEQQRIVAKVDELMALCDRLEAQQDDAAAAHAQLVQTLLDSLTQAPDAADFAASWQRLSAHFDVLFTTEASIDALKQTILQLAVMGKLVPQDPSDEPVCDLLYRYGIKSESLPLRGWVKVILGDLGDVVGGATPSKSNPEFWGGDIPWVSPKDMKRSVLNDSQDHVSSSAVQHTSLKVVPAGSLLMVVRGMILAHSFPVALAGRELTINQDMKALVVPGELAPYLFLYLKAMKNVMVGLVDRSGHGTCKLVSEKLWGHEVALPPVDEQRRIVEKIDELMSLCDKLKANLNAARQLHEKLAGALVEQAVA